MLSFIDSTLCTALCLAFVRVYFLSFFCKSADFLWQVNHLTSQVTELQRSLITLQQETDSTITRLKQELADKVGRERGEQGLSERRT